MAANMASHFRNLTNFEAFIPSTPILEYSPLGKNLESRNVLYSGEKIDDFRQSFTDSDDDIVDTPQLNWSKFSAVAEIGRATLGTPDVFSTDARLNVTNETYFQTEVLCA